MFDIKDPSETVVLTFDGTDGLAGGETLSAVQSVAVDVVQGVDANASAVVSSGAINTAALTINGNTIAVGCGVTAPASGGVSGCAYLIRITCTTSNPNKVLTLKGVLPVSEC